MTDEPFGHPPADDGTDPEDDPLPPTLREDRPADDGGDLAGGGDGRIPRRYRGSLAASALAAGMIGLRDVLEDPKDDRPVVEQFADDDAGDRDVELHLDPDDPAASTIRFRSP